MTLRFRHARLALFAAVSLVGSIPAAQAQTTICDTDPNAVPFEATIDASRLNDLLARLGNVDAPPPSTPPALTLPGVCVDHRIPITLPSLRLPVGESADLFTVETSPGQVTAHLDLLAPFNFEIDGANYQAVNCDSTCVIEVPYLGEIFDGCAIEAGAVGPVLGLLVDVGVSWDSTHVTQTADTCVLGDCTAVHPLTSTQVTLSNFDVDATGFGDCGFCFPAPLDFLGCLNPCDGIDGLLGSLTQPAVESMVEAAFGLPPAEGLLIRVFSRDIVRDGCMDIPEVRECRNPTSVETGQIRSPRDHGLNGVLYSLPLAVALGLTVRLRRRGSAGRRSG